MAIENQILEYLKEKEGFVFCIKDMFQFGDYKAVAKAIERLEKKGEIERIITGIYYYPLINKLFSMAYPPDIIKVAEALSRNYGWDILPSGNTALNQLGLSTQVSAKYLFISSGPNREYLINNTSLVFKNAVQSNFYSCKKIGLIVQSLKTLTERNITSTEIIKMRKLLNDLEKKELLKEMKQAPIWMHKYLKEIGECL